MEKHFDKSFEGLNLKLGMRKYFAANVAMVALRQLLNKTKLTLSHLATATA